MRRKQDTLPLGWILVATVILSIIVWLPLLYSWSNLGLRHFVDITAFTPHQSIFTFAILPFAIFASIVAVAIIVIKLGDAASTHPIIQWTSKNWPVIVLVGIMLASVISLADYFFTPKSFDKFEAAPVQTILTCGVGSKPSNTPTCGTLADFLQVKHQKADGLISPVSYLFVQIQVLVIISIAFTCLFSCALYIASNFVPNLSLTSARPAIFFALSLFATYPVLFGLWRYETARVTGAAVDNLGYIVVFALIVVIALLILFTDKASRNATATIGQIVPLLTLAAGFVAVKFKGYDVVSPLLGVEANLATRLYVIIAVTLVGLIISGILLLQYQFRDDL